MRLLFAFDTCRFSYCSRFTCVHVIFSLCWLVGCTFTGLHGPRMLGIVGGPHNFSLVIPFIWATFVAVALRFMGLAGLSIIHLLCICDWLFMMDESAWFGMDPSEDKDDLDEWSLVFEAVSQPDRIRNSVSVSRQPSCKSAPLPAPAYRHDFVSVSSTFKGFKFLSVWRACTPVSASTTFWV